MKLRKQNNKTNNKQIKLLEKDPQKRLGTPGCSAGDIIDQPFFKNINWDKLDRKEIEPPFKPKVVRIHFQLFIADVVGLKTINVSEEKLSD